MKNHIDPIVTISTYMKYDDVISPDTAIVLILNWSERIHYFRVILHGGDIIL